MTRSVGPAGNVVSELVQGALGGAEGGSSLPRMLGDVAMRALPIVGEARAAKDLYEGVTKADPALMLSGIIGLIPVAGSLSGLAKTGGKQVLGELGKVATEKGTTAAALHFQKIVAEGARTLAKDPASKKLVKEAAERAGNRALELLQDNLLKRQQSGELPQIVTSQHSNISDAMRATREALGVKDTSDWQNLFSGEGAGRKVIGRHQAVSTGKGEDEVLSTHGFRLVPPELEDGATRGDFKLIRWKQTPREGGEPALELGVESFLSSQDEAAAIMQRFADKAKAFRTTRT